MDLYQFYLYNTSGVKTGTTPWVTSWNNSNEEGRNHFVGKMTQVSDPGPSWPSCITTFLKIHACPFENRSYKEFNIESLQILTDCGKNQF